MITPQSKAIDDLESFKAKHRMSVFLSCSDSDFQSHAAMVLAAFRVAYPDDELLVSEKMNGLADEIWEMRLNTPTSDEHHERASKAIRLLAERRVACPWSDHTQELEASPQLFRLASALWDCNPRGENKWYARFSRTLAKVWTEEDPSFEKKIRPAASRLSDWMDKRGVNFSICVRREAERFECEILP